MKLGGGGNEPRGYELYEDVRSRGEHYLKPEKDVPYYTMCVRFQLLGPLQYAQLVKRYML